MLAPLCHDLQEDIISRNLDISFDVNESSRSIPANGPDNRRHFGLALWADNIFLVGPSVEAIQEQQFMLGDALQQLDLDLKPRSLELLCNDEALA